jgi:uncharacterized protein YndB with AHSA1/START domain
MPKPAPAKRADRFSDDAVRAKTGKNWQQWFDLLDKAQAHTMNHTAIAAYIHDELGCPSWWSQMVTVQYERERGLREKHQRPGGGYSVSASKTMAVPVAKLFAAWEDGKLRRRWLPDGKLTIRKATPNKSLRMTWGDGATRVEANFYAKGDAKSQVAIEHLKLTNKNEALRMKAYWGEALERLKKTMEK